MGKVVEDYLWHVQRFSTVVVMPTGHIVSQQDAAVTDVIRPYGASCTIRLIRSLWGRHRTHPGAARHPSAEGITRYPGKPEEAGYL
jgi:hypothetical protein